jgi:hypothetical protein
MPGVNVGVVAPPRVPAATVMAGVSPCATRYAAVEAFCPASDAALWTFSVPARVMEEKPGVEVPGLSPKSPVITEGPVLVIVEPAITAYDVAVPRSMFVAAAALSLAKAMSVIKLSKPTPNVPRPSRARERLAERWVGLRNIENFDGEE